MDAQNSAGVEIPILIADYVMAEVLSSAAVNQGLGMVDYDIFSCAVELAKLLVDRS